MIQERSIRPCAPIEPCVCGEVPSLIEHLLGTRAPKRYTIRCKACGRETGRWIRPDILVRMYNNAQIRKSKDVRE